MKKIVSFLISILSLFLVVSCATTPPENPSTPDTPSTPSTEPLPNDNLESLPLADEDVGFAIHFYKKRAGYQGYNLWIWENATGAEGADYSWTGQDEFGAVARYKFEDFSNTIVDNGIGFIVKTAKTWAEGATKDYNEDRFMDFSVLERDKYGYYNIYVKSQDAVLYTDAEGSVLDVIKEFFISYNEAMKYYTIRFSINNEYESYEIKQDDEVIISNETIADNPNVVTKGNKRLEYILGTSLPNILSTFTIDVRFKVSQKTRSKIADMTYLYRTKEFEDLYTYNGDLGAIYTKEKTTFRVWSPVSSEIKLRIYNTGTPASVMLGGKNVSFANGSNEHQEYPMTKIENGAWEVSIDGDLEGKYYTYVVTNKVYQETEVVDPYAKSTGINGLRGMIVDFSKTNPDGWESVKLNGAKEQDLVVYEVHIADLTSSSTWNGTPANAKTYKGFYEAGTTYEGVKTGFDHIKELGVNAVQILPIFDQANDERQDSIREDGTKREFNWGYNPLNYNALDGIYSQDPFDGYTKVREFKELVKAYSNAGMNIIMDVVYNHVNSANRSNFDILMPNYYFRYSDSKLSNGSGCGNETSSELAMFRKFMIDSTEFWAKEYKLGGFRFDLMALHDITTMNSLAKNLKETVDPTITVYGEPWTGGTSALSENAAKQLNMDLYKGYGCFNDQMRDSLIKGGMNGVADKGWITNNENTVGNSDINNIISGIKGKVLASSNQYEVEKCVNYVTCHDNYTLYDRIKAAGIKDEDTVKKMAMLSNSLVFTSQGITFMLSGEEFLRTKGGNENSYNASYKVNELDYALKVANKDMFENYQKLIALKKNTDLFRKTSEDAKNITVTVSEDKNLIVYDIVDSLTNKEYRIIHCNGLKTSTDTVVNLEGYTLYLDTLNTQDLVLGANVKVNPYQTIIAYK